MAVKKRAAALFFILVLVFALCAPCALATEQTIPESTTATTTTTAAPAVLMSKLYVTGSNGKYYPCSPKLSSGGNKFSFTVPDWMEECTVCIISDSASSVSCDGAEVSSSGSTHKLEVKLESNNTKLSVELKGSSGTRTLSITIYREAIKCYIERLNLLDADNEAIDPTSGTVAEGLVYTFAAGTKTAHLRLVPRHEQEVWVENLTVDSTGTLVGGTEAKKKIELANDRYDADLPLIDGTNKFTVTVTAGSTTVTCGIEIIVGDAAANTVVTTTSTTESTAPPTQATVPTTAPTQAQSSGGGNLLSVFSNMSTGMGILIGIIITVIIGAFIFMIVNMSSGSDDRRDDYSEPMDPVYRPRRRNLADYADDDYYDDYGIRPRQRQDDYGYDSRAPRGGYGGEYDPYGYDNYDNRSQRGGGFYDRYREPQPRFGYEDDDDGYGY